MLLGNFCEKQQPITFDLRGYAAYIKSNGLKGTDITSEIMNRSFKERESQRKKKAAFSFFLATFWFDRSTPPPVPQKTEVPAPAPAVDAGPEVTPDDVPAA